MEKKNTNTSCRTWLCTLNNPVGDWRDILIKFGEKADYVCG